MRTTRLLLVVALAAAGLAATPVASAGSTSAAPACSNLILSLVRTTGAAGSRGWDMALRNGSADTCRLDGFPHMTLLDSHAATVRVPVQRPPGFTTHPVTLRPWQRAHFSFVYVVGGAGSACTLHYFSASACASRHPAAPPQSATTADGLRSARRHPQSGRRTSIPCARR